MLDARAPHGPAHPPPVESQHRYVLSELVDVFSSRAEFLGLGMGVCKVPRKRPREKSNFKDKRNVCFGWEGTYGCLYCEGRNTISFGFTGKVV